MHGTATAMAPAPLLRSQTGPVIYTSASAGATDPHGRQSSMSANYSGSGTPVPLSMRNSQQSGRTIHSDSTTSLSSILSSTSTLVQQQQQQQHAHEQPRPASNGGPLIATSNIINEKADASRSLYQICVSLCQRLALVPGFDPFLDSLDPLDPVDTLWALLRTGTPLLTIFNAVRPAEPLQDDDAAASKLSSEQKRTQRIVFKFIHGCVKLLPSQECFLIKDLTDNDTTGFVKVIRVVNCVLDIADERGFLLPPPLPSPFLYGTGTGADSNGDPSRPASRRGLSGFGMDGHGAVSPAAPVKMTQRDYIVQELIDTERKYVQDLENLHDLKRTLEQRSIVPGDIIYQIFLNINSILDFQRRLLIKFESINSMPIPQQRWGAPFVMNEESFDIYRPFITNQRTASLTAAAAFDQIMLANHPVAIDSLTFESFLSKPMLRLTKYPLLLKTLIKTATDEETRADLTAGMDVAERLLQNANGAVNEDLLEEALEDLRTRVDDWKTLRWRTFGKLVLQGVYGVVTGKTESEKDYEIYLFETILLCCKEFPAPKIKDKNKEKTKSIGPKARSGKLQLKGRIFMINVTDVVSISKPGSHSVQIWWKGDPGVENFTIRFGQEEVMKKWAATLDSQRKEHAPRSSKPRISGGPDSEDFFWMQSQNMTNLENPYAEKDEDEDDVDSLPTMVTAPSPAPSQHSISRNGSHTNLRQRSSHSDSSQNLAGMARVLIQVPPLSTIPTVPMPPPPRYPMSTPPLLSLQTQTSSGSSNTISPGPRVFADSYFSPIESPPSSRTSVTSGLISTPTSSHHFPRGLVPGMGWEESNRYTAPAMPRAPSRDGLSPVPLGVSGSRNPRGPSLPVMMTPGQMSAAQLQRSRSYSTADIHGLPVIRRNMSNLASVPAVPGIPPHLHEMPRSHTASPRPEGPTRASTQSPGAQRDRLNRHQHSGSFGGSVTVVSPAYPVYSRQGTPNSQNGSSDLSPAYLGRTVSPAATVTGFSAVLAPPTPFSRPDLFSSVMVVPDGSEASGELPAPTQLKVKVTCDSGNYVTLVVPYTTTYQSLIDRIDAKLARFASGSIGRGSLKLRYRDEDGDLITIQSDDDIQIAFMEWREGARNSCPKGVMGEIQLYCVAHGRV